MPWTARMMIRFLPFPYFRVDASNAMRAPSCDQAAEPLHQGYGLDGGVVVGLWEAVLLAVHARVRQRLQRAAQAHHDSGFASLERRAKKPP